MTTTSPLERQLLIVGLGNPGKEHAPTRHNAGWQAVDRLAAALNVTWRKAGLNERAEGLVGDCRLVLIKPQTYMNRSGQAVSAALGGREMASQNTIVIYDDVEVKLGSWRTRAGGGHGGHNGMRSIIETVGSDCLRLRLGIGPVPEQLGGAGPDRDLDKFVLDRFTSSEESILNKLLDDLVANLLESISSGEIALATQYSN